MHLPLRLRTTPATGTCLGYSQHAANINEVLASNGVMRGNKSTHIGRDRGAELMVEMGCPADDIQRAGGWKQDTCSTSYFVPSSNPRSQLALAMWPVDGGHFNAAYYDDRFRQSVLEELVWHVAPWMQRALRVARDAKAAAAAGDSSQQAAADCLPTLDAMLLAFVAAIQDAAVLADDYPENMFIKDLKQHPKFE
jgi:hypothetical protein